MISQDFQYVLDRINDILEGIIIPKWSKILGQGYKIVPNSTDLAYTK